MRKKEMVDEVRGKAVIANRTSDIALTLGLFMLLSGWIGAAFVWILWLFR